ncbi:MAG: Jag N-terminal domain-containing protein [Candidatus Omnitrophota bacterium]
MTDMSKAIEFDGKTLEMAIKKAEESLHVSRETLDIRVVCEEQRGLFGMEGAKLAKIKVKIKNLL